jgi:putative ABC transport system permease protein
MHDWHSEVRARLAALRLRPEREADIVDEIAQHLAERYRDAISGGAPPEEATRSALAEFKTGNALAQRISALEQAHTPVAITLGASTGNRLADVWRDIRYAARSFAKQPGFAATAVLILALGIGANTAIFSAISAVLLRPLPFPDPDRLVVLWQDRSSVGGPARGMPAWADYVEWQRRSRSFDGLAAIADISFNLTGDGEPEKVEASHTTANLFSLLGTQPLLGRTFTSVDEGPAALPVVVIDEHLWLRRFGGDPDVIGQSMVLDGLGHTVIGVVASDFRFPDDNAIWVPASPDQLAGQSSVFVIGRLAGGTPPAEAAAEMSTLTATLREERGNADSGVRIVVRGLHDHLARNARPTLIMLLGAVALVLLITCANVANLLLARGTIRSRELSLRQALGAARSRLVGQLLTESALLAVSGVLVGIALAVASLGYLTRLVPNGLPDGAAVALDWRVLVFTIGLALTTVALFGVGPALTAARLDPATGLRKGAAVGGTTRGRLRDALVVAEITLTVVLLAAGGLLLRSYGAILSVDPGFSPQNVFVAQTFPAKGQYDDLADRRAFYRGVLERVRALPGVTDADYVNYPPLTLQGGETRITPENRSDSAPSSEPRYSANFRAVSAGYFATLGARLLGGRHFDERDGPDAPRSVVVNESLARQLWPDRDPVGARLKVGDARSTQPWFTVIGVVGDIRQTKLDSRPEPEMYFSFDQPPSNAPFLWPRHLVFRTAGDSLPVASAVRDAIWDVDPNQSITWIRPMTDLIDDDLASRSTQLVLFGVFAGVALLLAAVGLYGVLAYAVAQRTAEIGVRMALGAPRASVVRSVVGRALLLAAVGLAFGIVGAFGATRLIASFLFGVTPNDVATFAGVAAVILFVSGCASYFPARRAAAVDPISVLRTE